MTKSVQPEWCLKLPLQQQSVLFLAARGPDGIAKAHPCKAIVQAYRACVLVAAKYGRCLEYGEHADSFMSLAAFADGSRWKALVDDFFLHEDALPHHYLMHLMHGAQILGHKHPDGRFRDRWIYFYTMMVAGLHLRAESEAEMDLRLNDWGRSRWK